MSESQRHPSDDHSAAAGPIQPAIRVMMMPKDTNAMGTIFGGLILSYIDLAGAVEAHRWAQGRVVTVALHEVEFHAPVFVGELVSFYTETVSCGTTSVRVRVTVEVSRRGGETNVKVTQAEVVYVRVDDSNRPVPLERSYSAEPLSTTARSASSAISDSAVGT